MHHFSVGRSRAKDSGRDRKRVRRKEKREWEYRVKISLIVCWVVMYMSHCRFNGCNPNFFIIVLK